MGKRLAKDVFSTGHHAMRGTSGTLIPDRAPGAGAGAGNDPGARSRIRSLNSAHRFMRTHLVVVGNARSRVGAAGRILGPIGLIRPEFFTTATPSGMRVIGSVAIAGCLRSAIGFGLVDFDQCNSGSTDMFRKSDYFILLAVMISFFISAYFWFVAHDREQAIFTAIWIPAIFGFGIYFKVAALLGRKQ